jgi:hypothetical protein
MWSDGRFPQNTTVGAENIACGNADVSRETWWGDEKDSFH